MLINNLVFSTSSSIQCIRKICIVSKRPWSWNHHCRTRNLKWHKQYSKVNKNEEIINSYSIQSNMLICFLSKLLRIITLTNQKNQIKSQDSREEQKLKKKEKMKEIFTVTPLDQLLWFQFLLFLHKRNIISVVSWISDKTPFWMPKITRKHFLKRNRHSMNLNCLEMLWWCCYISGKYLSLINRLSRSFTLSSLSSTTTHCFRSFSIRILIRMSIVSGRIKCHQWFSIWIWHRLRFVFLQRRSSHTILRHISRISSYRLDQLTF